MTSPQIDLPVVANLKYYFYPKHILIIDRNSLFQRRGRAPDKSTVKRRFCAIIVTMRCCNTNVWRHCGSLATHLLREVVSCDFPALGGVRVAGESGKVLCDSHGDFSCRVCHTCFSALDRTLNPQSGPAVIVRHWILKPWRDDLRVTGAGRTPC